ncbi:MAG TPA: riboflavin biosynthesis protein RibF [Opitutaceae bacterium]|nr:riboflavin biosynthesis protein RibF [Opitutaceae bacterium]
MNPPQQFFGLDRVALPARPLHLAIGMYDGVHLGHQAVIESAIHSARRSGGIAGVLTFWPHPSALFNPAKRSRMIMSPEMKFRVLHRLGVDVVIQQPFTLEFARIEAEDFLPYLKRHLPGLAGIYVGENWRFGAGRRGDVALLLAQARQQQVPVLSASRIQYNGGPISSTRIRECLEAGQVAEANSLLGYSYFAEGEIIPGRRLGRTIGFPTLNLAWEPELQPRHGVYAVRIVNGLAGAPLPGVANYGLRPTVAEATAPLLETHVLGECPYDGGDRIMVEWLQFLRPEGKFAGLEELRAQIVRDVAAARTVLADFSLR